MNILPTASGGCPTDRARTRGGRASWQRRLDVRHLWRQECREHARFYRARRPADGDEAGSARPRCRSLSHEREGHEPEGDRHFLYNDCELKGLSGISNDIRELLKSADPQAKRTLDYFVHRIALSAGMLAAAMGGIDGFVFTAGIGENARAIREAVVKRLNWLGIELDPDANERGARSISRKESPRRLLCYSDR